MKRFNVSGRQKAVPGTKGYQTTTIERPTYFATLKLGHEIAISVLV